MSVRQADKTGNGVLQPASSQVDTDASGVGHRARNVNLHVRVVVVGTRLSFPFLKPCSAD